MAYKYAVFQSASGKRFVIDLERKRMDTLRKKLQAWAEVAKGLWSTRGVKKCFITLTYDTDGTVVAPSEWHPLHISEYLKSLKRRAGLEVLAFAWVVEVQARGVPHYHVVLIYRGSVPYPDKSGMWKHGLSNVLFKLRSPFYLVKYTGKKHQKDFSKLPKGVRAFACSFSDLGLRDELRVALLPEVIRERYRDEGVTALADLVRPSWMRSSFVGNASSKEFADYLKSGD